MLYKLKNNVTGEIKEELMTVSQKEQYMIDNPDWVNVLDCVPRVIYKGLGWQANERREDIHDSQTALDNAYRERDAYQHSFDKHQGIYKKANYAHDKAVEQAVNQSSSHGNDLGDLA